MPNLINVHSPLIKREKWTSDTKKNAFLSSDTLKTIALITMIIDHIAAIFLPSESSLYIFLRFIGRFSFPIYAFLLTEGYLYTANKGKYLSRLMLFAIISEIPYNLAFYDKIFYLNMQNIFFELSAGLFAIYVYEKLIKNRNRFIALFGVFVIAAIAETAGFSYGALGILVIMIFFWFRSNVEFKSVAFVAVVIFYEFININMLQYNPLLSLLLTMGVLNTYMVLGVIPITLYNGKKGTFKINKYFHYIIYPAHLLLFFFVNKII